MMMKKLVCITAALTLALSLAACGGSSSTPTDGSSAPGSSAPASSAPASSAPASTPAEAGAPLDEAGYTTEAMTLVTAAQEFSAAFEGFVAPTTFTDEDIAAMTEDAMARIEAGRKALQAFYDFAEVTPPAGMEETHEAISTAAAKMADSANTYLDVVEGVLKDEVDPDDYQAAEDAYTVSANEAANELVAALSKLDPSKM